MKKIFTLVAATLLTVAAFAADGKPSMLADRRPVVTVTAGKNYEVVIDGQSYSSYNGTVNISSLRSGQHSIRVYEASRGFMFKKAKKVVSATSFILKNNSIDITVGFRGQIMITEKKADRDWNNGRDMQNGHMGQDNHGQGNDRDHRF